MRGERGRDTNTKEERKHKGTKATNRRGAQRRQEVVKGAPTAEALVVTWGQGPRN